MKVTPNTIIQIKLGNYGGKRTFVASEKMMNIRGPQAGSSI